MAFGPYTTHSFEDNSMNLTTNLQDLNEEIFNLECDLLSASDDITWRKSIEVELSYALHQQEILRENLELGL